MNLAVMADLTRSKRTRLQQTTANTDTQQNSQCAG